MTQTKAKKPAAGAATPAKKFPILPVAFGALALVLVASIMFTGDQAIGGEFGDPEVIGETLPPFLGQTQDDPAIGMPAPEVVGEDFDGNTVEIRHDGTPKAIVFLAHWCPHCQQEVPRVQAWLDATGGVPGVELYSVATATSSARPNYPPSEWLERERWSVPVIKDSNDFTVHTAFGAGGFPYWVFLHGDGTVAARSAGELDVPILEGFLTDLAAQG